MSLTFDSVLFLLLWQRNNNLFYSRVWNISQDFLRPCLFTSCVGGECSKSQRILCHGMKLRNSLMQDSGCWESIFDYGELMDKLLEKNSCRFSKHQQSTSSPSAAGSLSLRLLVIRGVFLKCFNALFKNPPLYICCSPMVETSYHSSLYNLPILGSCQGTVRSVCRAGMHELLCPASTHRSLCKEIF